MVKYAFLLFLLLTISLLSFSQAHTDKCEVKVKEATPHVVLDKLRYYSVEFYNGSQKTVDALEWDASFYDKFNKLLGVRTGVWSSGKWISPIQPGEYKKDREMPDEIGDAEKVIIKIKKVHFINETSCE
jgi:hypothetical protein